MKKNIFFSKILFLLHSVVAVSVVFNETFSMNNRSPIIPIRSSHKRRIEGENLVKEVITSLISSCTVKGDQQKLQTRFMNDKEISYESLATREKEYIASIFMKWYWKTQKNKENHKDKISSHLFIQSKFIRKSIDGKSSKGNKTSDVAIMPSFQPEPCFFPIDDMEIH